MSRIFFFFGLFIPLLTATLSLQAHQEIYHVDPPITEHAHMEYEAVLGTTYLRNQEVGGIQQDLLLWEVEGNLPFTPDWSVEAVLPFGSPVRGGRDGFGLGDLELEPRWVFYESEKIVLNAGLPVLFPTGDEARGLSEDLWALEPTFRFDLFFPNADLYSNTTLGIGINREEIDWTQSAALVYLWRVNPELTLSPIAELTGTVSKNEEDSFSGAAGFGAAFREWFGLVEFEAPFVRGGEPDWKILVHVGFHKVKQH